MHVKTSLLSPLATILFGLGTAFGGQIGDIAVFYNSTAPSPCPANLTAACAANNAAGVLDGPAFVILNTSGIDITNAVLTVIGEDFFDVGTISANSSVTVIAGISNDGQSHGASNFFTATGSAFDSSDHFSSLNTDQLELTGQQGGAQVQSLDVCGIIAAPIFTPACTAGPSTDGTVSSINFLGGPGDNDAPCNNCFAPQIVANLITVGSSGGVPEPSSFAFLCAGLVALIVVRRVTRGPADSEGTS
jgi:hypothetical protein